MISINTILYKTLIQVQCMTCGQNEKKVIL